MKGRVGERREKTSKLMTEGEIKCNKKRGREGGEMGGLEGQVRDRRGIQDK